MKIVVNTRQASAGMHGGVVRYTTEILKRLSEAETVAPPEKMTSGALGHLWEQAVLPARLGGSVLWSPANFGPLAVRKQLVSIYDLSPIDHPEWFGPRYRQLFGTMIPLVAKRAAAIAVPSSFTAERISDRFGIDPDKLLLTKPGLGDCFTIDEAVERTNQVVAVAGPDPRKNLHPILEAWAMVADALPSYELTVIGGRRPVGVFADQQALPVPPRTRFVHDCSDAELVRSYQEAAAVVFVPSYEGFGMPAIEALACGADLICSDISPLRSVVADMSNMVRPGSVSELAAAMRAVAGSEAIGPTDRRIRSERLRAEFSWDESARVIEKALLKLHDA